VVTDTRHRNLQDSENKTKLDFVKQFDIELALPDFTNLYPKIPDFGYPTAAMVLL
jgi:hypothetical protein